MLLLFFSTVRLSYFGEVPFLEANSLIEQMLLIIAVATNLVLAWRRNSSILWVLGNITGCGAALAGNNHWYFAGLMLALVIDSVYAQIAKEWRNLAPVVVSLATTLTEFSAIVIPPFSWNRYHLIRP